MTKLNLLTQFVSVRDAVHTVELKSKKKQRNALFFKIHYK